VGDLRHISSSEMGPRGQRLPALSFGMGRSRVLDPTLQEAVVVGGVWAVLRMVVRTTCWCWRQRSLRKTLVALKQEDRKTLVALERARGGNSSERP
jgi:hypothetical protein